MRRTATSLAATAILLGGLGSSASLYRDAEELQTGIDPRLPESPNFEFSWLRGELHLSGHTVSLTHEDDLREVAAAVFPGKVVVTNFQALGIVPDYWENTTLQVLYSLAPTTSAHARLIPGHLNIRGIAIDSIGWHSRFKALSESLHAAIEVSANTIVVDASIDPLRACGNSFRTFVSGPINFEESSALFHSSAYPRLARVAALADACRDSVIAITGHTDNTGTESWNQQLSLRRAQAVANHLVSSGIDQERLNIRGSGSSEPLYKNDTRYRRSLNRRIEIVMTATDRPRPD